MNCLSTFLLLVFVALGFNYVADARGNSTRLHKRSSVTRYDTTYYSTTSGKTFSIYHTNWAMYGRNYQVSDLPINYLTDIVYAFLQLQAGTNGYTVATTDSYADTERNYQGWGPSNTLPFNGNFGEFYLLKQNGKKFNLLVSVGGWTLSNTFSTAMATATSRASIVSSLLSFFDTYPIFVGVSIDWEYLSNNGVNYGNSGNAVSTSDVSNFIAFLQLLRQQLNANGKSYYKIAFCASAAPEKIKWDVASVGANIDELHVMTYDFASSSWGDPTTTHQSNLYPSSTTLYSASAAVDYYLAGGMPASKIFIGAAYYSRGFANTNGLGQPGSGTVSVMSWEIGVADYKALPPSGYTEYWDATCQATYAYSSSAKQFLSYDSVASIKAKADYVWSKGLGGIIAWESSGDVVITNSRSLDYAMWNQLTARTSSGSSSNGNSNVATTAAAAKTTAAAAKTSAAAAVKTTAAAAKTTAAAVKTTQSSATATQAASGTWKAGTYYAAGTIVTYNGVAYKVIQSHTSLTGWEPNTTPALFTPVGTATTAAAVAKTSAAAVKTTAAAVVKTTAAPAATNAPSSSVAAWKANTYYAVGTIVTYNGASYKCIQAHTSLTGWEPSIVPALWSKV